MAPHGVVECEGRKEEFSIRGQVVVNSIDSFEAEVAKPESPNFGLHAHATVMTSNGQSESNVDRAVSLVVQGDDRKPFTIKIEPDGLGVMWVDGVEAETYEEEIPNILGLVVLGNEGR